MLWGYLWKQMRLPFEIFNLEQPSTFVQSLHQNEFGQSKCCPAKKRKTTAFVKNGIVSIPCSWIEAFQFHSIVLSIMSWHCLYMSRTHISQRNWLARPLLRNLGFEANPTLVCQKITNFFFKLSTTGHCKYCFLKSHVVIYMWKQLGLPFCSEKFQSSGAF